MLELNNVSLQLGSRVLVKPFSLAIKAGEIVTLMGASGTGKSSLLSFIGGDLPDSFTGFGDIILDGIRLTDIVPERRHIGRLFQDDLLFPHMTVGENLLFAIARAPKADRLSTMRAALQRAELAGFEDRAPHTLSGGQRARVSLMRSLLARPAAILLDEPFGSLDQELRQSVRAYTFAHIRERDIPALLVTHDRSDAPDGGRIFSIGAEGDVTHV